MTRLTKLTNEKFANPWGILFLDLGLSTVASLLAILLMRWTSEPFLNFQRFTLIWLGVSLLASCAGFLIFGTNKIVIRYSDFKAISLLTNAIVIKEAILIVCVILDIIGNDMVRIDVTTLILDAMFSVFLLIMTRVLLIQIINSLSNNIDDNLGRVRVMVYGTSSKALSLLTRLGDSTHYDVVGILADDRAINGQIIQSTKVYSYNNKEELEKIRTQAGVEGILFTHDTNESEKSSQLIRLCMELGIHILNSPKIEDAKFGHMSQKAVKEISNDVAYIADGMTGLGRYAKSLFDRVVSGICLIIFSPLFLIVYIAIKLEDRGPAIYKQERIGRFGRPFNIYKFRSMRTDAEAMGPALYSGEDDPRLTKVGKFIRAHHLDELPQLFNVFKGDMSFIGWRPERQFYIDQIMEVDPRYYYLYQIRPGVTSYATLYNGYTDTLEKMLKRLEYDLYYLRHRSWWFDIKILFMTFMSIAFGKKF